MAPPAEGQRETAFSAVFHSVMRFLAVYALAVLFYNSVMPKGGDSGASKKPAGPPGELQKAIGNELPKFPGTDRHGQRRNTHRPHFSSVDEVDLWVFLSTSPDAPTELSIEPSVEDPVPENTTVRLRLEPSGAPLFLWHRSGCRVARKSDLDVQSLHLGLEVTREFLDANASIFAHSYLARNGAHPSTYSAHPSHPQISASPDVVLYRFNLTRFSPPPVVRETRSLLADDDEGLEDAAPPETPVDESSSYITLLHPTLDLRIAHFYDQLPLNGAPASIRPRVRFDAASANYFPPVYHHDFWTLSHHFIAINDTWLGEEAGDIGVRLSIGSIGMWTWILQTQLQDQWDAQASSGLSRTSDQDALRKLLLETNPYLLAVTVLVTVLHLVFQFLAFRHDVAFWRKNKSAQGLSLTAYAMDLFFRVVIFLYLMDNDTAWLVLAEHGLAILLELWKIRRLVKVQVDWTSGALPRISVDAVESYAKGNTRKFDEVAMVHLTYVIAPCLVGFSSYSLAYGKHRGWYSWGLSSVVGFVYAFGFISLTPQLFINYKLKSVAHMPWKAMVYKALGTFIDDFYAFVIDMPLLHRLSCLRDDVIFFGFLYQRWLYPVDMARVNEFGQGGDADGDTLNEHAVLAAPSGGEAPSAAGESLDTID